MLTKSAVLSVVLILLSGAACKRQESAQITSSGENSTAAPQASVSPQSNTQASVAPGTAKTDACALLTSADVQAVQREAIKETKLSGSTEGGFTVSQCFFTLPTFTNSISLQITQSGEGSRARDPKEFWLETFHRDERSEKEKDKDKDKERNRKQGEEEEESAPPLNVNGVGDEAFWMGSRVGGALYVLKGHDYIRISIGGAEDQAEKIKKSKELAQKVISRLQS